jgi:AraC family transcriptional regulator
MLIRSPAEGSRRATELPASFDARWGRENCIIWGRYQDLEFGPYTHTLSIRAAWGGVQYCHFNGRIVAIDDDNFLILNHGRVYSTSIRAAEPVEALAICFAPTLIERSHGAVADSIERALWLGEYSSGCAPEFLENLQPHDGIVSPVLQLIREHLKRGLADEAWLDEQLVLLLARMQTHHEQLMKRVDCLGLVRPATRREVYRRIALATDFLHTNYALQVELATLASVCDLSKYHLLRLFRLVHGVTPSTFLLRKRAETAARLLSGTSISVDAVAKRVGFSSTTMLLRQLRSLPAARNRVSGMLE